MNQNDRLGKPLRLSRYLLTYCSVFFAQLLLGLLVRKERVLHRCRARSSLGGDRQHRENIQRGDGRTLEYRD